VTGRSPLTVAGAVSDLAPFGSSAPNSLFIPPALGVGEPSPLSCGSLVACVKRRRLHMIAAGRLQQVLASARIRPHVLPYDPRHHP
jgi:hypothetical protein